MFLHKATTSAEGVSRNAKEHFTTISPAEMLEKVALLPISQWNYKTDPADHKHVGPMAQDFHTMFGLNGAEDKRISLTDEGGVALAAIQGLNQKLDEKDVEIQTLEQQNDSLTERLNKLEATVEIVACRPRMRRQVRLVRIGGACVSEQCKGYSRAITGF